MPKIPSNKKAVKKNPRLPIRELAGILVGMRLRLQAEAKFLSDLEQRLYSTGLDSTGPIGEGPDDCPFNYGLLQGR
jgi:hypothetical protein